MGLIGVSTFSVREHSVTKAESEIPQKHAINYNEKRKAITLSYIASVVGTFYNIPVEEIYGQSRQKNIMQARKAVIYLTKEIINDSFESIGMALGGRKHSTIMYSHKEAGDLIKTNLKFQEEINTLFNIINQS